MMLKLSTRDLNQMTQEPYEVMGMTFNLLAYDLNTATPAPPVT